MDSASPDGREPSRKRRRQSSSVSAMRSSDTASPHTELGHMRSDDITGSTSFVGSGSGIAFVQTVRSALARNMSWDNNVFDSEMVPGEDDHITTRNSPDSLWHGDEVLTSAEEQDRSLASISFEDLVYWSQSYFNIWHAPFPFLHAPSILGLFETISSRGFSALNDIEKTIVRSVLSISVADRRQMPGDLQNNTPRVPSSLLFSTVDEAISNISPLLVHLSTLSGLQAAVSIQVFLISILRLNTASRFGGLIVRIAFHLGLHRCPSRYRQFSAAEADIRRRLFWSIYSLEMFLAQSLGLPITLKDEDVDVCFHDEEKHPVNHKDSQSIGQSFLGLHLQKFSAPDTHTDTGRFLLPSFLARSSRIKGLILELRHKSINHRVTDPDEVAHIDAEISRWWNEVQDFIDPSALDDDDIDRPVGQDSPDSLKPSHKLLLVVQKHESVILLNRPVITSGNNTFVVGAAMQKCISASKAIILRIFQHLQDCRRDERSLDGRILNPLFWPGFTWCIWMSGLILLYAASNGFYSVEAAQREATRCVKILENISLRGIFWPGACSAAIKDLQQALNQKTGGEPSKDPPADLPTRQQVIHKLRLGTSGARDHLRTESSLGGRGSTPATSLPPPEFGRGVTGAHDGSQNAAMSNLMSALPSGIENPPTAQLQPPSSSFQEDAAFLQNWPAMNGQFYPMEDQFNDFGDIFQLMDVPYHLSELT
ncbi:uncharacterized protein PAC_06389 [Phialocephala subalpina]|uniref:Xylanolytic transcriptional activator regulatory domain-containing protein n=1 Tax=Phialocephala subalpina TaxID=576137 RepID=A0A1L7WUQ1_9HELO|nr:uncharacterized protein PAC_06389 [Phialocephala subalpina]